MKKGIVKKAGTFKTESFLVSVNPGDILKIKEMSCGTALVSKIYNGYVDSFCFKIKFSYFNLVYSSKSIDR